MAGSQRNLTIRAKNIKDFYQFIYFVKYALKYNELVKENSNRFRSFSPETEKNSVEFFVDGEDYFKDLAHAIESAKKDIHMTGWWVSPEFFLIRPCSKNARYRFDNLLKAAAERGV